MAKTINVGNIHEFTLEEILVEIENTYSYATGNESRLLSVIHTDT